VDNVLNDTSTAECVISVVRVEYDVVYHFVAVSKLFRVRLFKYSIFLCCCLERNNSKHMISCVRKLMSFKKITSPDRHLHHSRNKMMIDCSRIMKRTTHSLCVQVISLVGLLQNRSANNIFCH
jgi:hypothetical protein